jgi:hypothetical protein
MAGKLFRQHVMKKHLFTPAARSASVAAEVIALSLQRCDKAAAFAWGCGEKRSRQLRLTRDRCISHGPCVGLSQNVTLM